MSVNLRRLVLPMGVGLLLAACSNDADLASAPAPPPPASQPAASTSPAEKSLGVFTVTCHTGSGQTASGKADGPGMAAVDTDVFPLGTRLRVQDVGAVVAADRGSAVDGRTVDIWKASTAACTDFGKRKLQVWQSTG